VASKELTENVESELERDLDLLALVEPHVLGSHHLRGLHARVELDDVAAEKVSKDSKPQPL
jgi:hypothetical protein